ncbi:MAG TPA: LacI family DNA-binding transcriptional regulator [Ktedonobacteraceae bacterium]|jgi:DNA-binding LacI/PurR family transcriptional regulator|nr:LacI family DNA-binding transcriptional regulator [Ktedonobacteraceae bacterium]
MAAKIKDVARLAGVSTATVSRVLSNEGYVSEEARKSVLAAMEQLRYQPSRLARSLRVQRSRIIGLLISDIQNPFFISLVRAVEDIALQHQYAVFLCNADENSEKEKFYLDLMQAERVAGVIVSPTRERDDPCLQLFQADIPFVVIDRKLADVNVDTVVVDNIQYTYQLVKHLLEDGHRRIGAVLGISTATTGRERYEGYAQALTEYQLPLSPELLRTSIPREENGYHLTNELLDLAEPPTALFVGNNLLTVGAFRAISERGRTIPDDIALAAFDEVDWMSLVKPGLTVIKQPTYDIGRTAAELLFQRIADPLLSVQQITVHCTLNIRQSCGLHQNTGVPASQVVQAAQKEREIV